MPKPLVIGIDIRDLRVAKTGTLTYLRELCHEFKKIDDADLHFHFIDSSFGVYSGNNKILKWIEHFKYQAWKQVILPLKAWSQNCDIVFCTDNFVPLIHLGYKTIPVFHDAFFFEMPQSYGKLWLWLYKKTALPAARRSPFIVTPTHYAKKQIQYYTGIPGDQLAVVYEGPRMLAGSADLINEAFLLSKALQKKQYLLHVGSFFKRKNIPALVQAFDQLKTTGAYPGLKLVLAGPLPSNTTDNDYLEVITAIKQTAFSTDIVLTGFISDDDLAALYKNALLYVFPSTNEGFGIPVLEAFNNGLPVLVANNTCLPEVGGDAVIIFDPFDVDDIAVKIKTVLDDSNLQQDLINKGYERLNYFSWQKAAAQLVDIFKKAATRS